VSGTYRFGTNTAPWRAWDDEILAIQTDAPAEAESTVWRFAHHRSNVAYDGDATRLAFWYQPHPNVSRDGKWILFTSNWEKTLGTDSAGEAGTAARQDVFLLALRPGRLPVAITGSTLPSSRATLPYSATLTATGGSGAFVWSAAGLPAGLALDATTGAITGSPLAAGTSTVAISVADAADATNAASASATVVIAPAPVTLTSCALSSGRVTVWYGAALQAGGGSGVFQWSIASGHLPDGVSLDPSTGAIAGTPTSTGSYSFTAAAADAADASNSATAAFSIDVAASPVVVVPVALPDGRQRVAYSATVQATGGAGSFTWSALTPLPSGLSLNASTGVIAGTPSAAGGYMVSLRATDRTDASNSASATLALSIAAAVKVASPRSLPDATAGVFYTYTVLAANVMGTPTWKLQGGALPPGMTLNATTGIISGICTTPDTYSFNARVKDANTNDTLTLTIVVR
jgi:Putative Ig domain